MKASYKYRISPIPGQKYRLARLFGCVCVVWNDSLGFCQEKYALREKKPVNSELQKQFIAQAQKTEDRKWLSEVSNILLQQSLNDLNQADQNFNCSSKHDRDKNAAINILVAGGQSEKKNGRGSKLKTTVKVAAVCVRGALPQQKVNSPRSFG